MDYQYKLFFLSALHSVASIYLAWSVSIDKDSLRRIALKLYSPSIILSILSYYTDPEKRITFLIMPMIIGGTIQSITLYVCYRAKCYQANWIYYKKLERIGHEIS